MKATGIEDKDDDKVLSTKNIKGNRLVVFAECHTPESVFRIPNGLDLEDKSIVEEWWVKYNQLHIHYVGQEEDVSIDPLHDFDDLKYLAECEIRPVDDHYADVYDEEDAEEEEEEDEKMKSELMVAFGNLTEEEKKEKEMIEKNGEVWVPEHFVKHIYNASIKIADINAMSIEDSEAGARE